MQAGGDRHRSWLPVFQATHVLPQNALSSSTSKTQVCPERKTVQVFATYKVDVAKAMDQRHLKGKE